ncbi:MAG: ATPase [Woeseiaceae bacterium]
MRYCKTVKNFMYLALVFSVTIANGEVLDAKANGFTIRHQVQIAADRNSVYQATVDDIGSWWNGDHTVSGDAANLYLDARPQGCFCERLREDAGLVHLSVSFVNPGVMLRLTGGLGPLGLMGVAGNMTWEFESNDQGTLMTLQYAVGGYMATGLDSLAVPVDGVLVEAATRLASFVETGSPSGETGSGDDL